MLLEILLTVLVLAFVGAILVALMVADERRLRSRLEASPARERRR